MARKLKTPTPAPAEVLTPPPAAPIESAPAEALAPPPAAGIADEDEVKPPARPLSEASPRTHESSGETCTVFHGDGQGPCQRCKHCDQKFRPSQMSQTCPVRLLARD